MNEAAEDEMEDLRKALQLAVCKIIFDEDREQGTRTTQSAIAALTELTYQYATKSLIPDLYTFSTHANRKSTISPDDVAVALRKLQSDQLEVFKRKFCRCGGKTSFSKNSSAALYNGNEDDGKRISTTGGRRRKRNEAEVLSLSSSSSSSDDDECDNDKMVDRKQKGAPHMLNTNFHSEKYTGGAVLRTGATGTPTTRRSLSSASSFPPKTNIATTGRNRAKSESLFNKFKLQSEPNACIDNKNVFDYDTSSTDKDDIARSPLKSLGMTKTTKTKAAVAARTAQKNRISRKFCLQGKKSGRNSDHPRDEERSKSICHSKNDTLLDFDDDSTDDDDIFLNRNANMTKEKNNLNNAYQVANPSDQDMKCSKPNRNKIQNSDDDFGTWDDELDNERNGGAGDDIESGAPKQSQVAKALANLSSDSGMDEDDSEEEDKIRLDAGKSTSSHRCHPLIESDTGD